MRILYLTHRLPYAANRGDRIRAYHMLRHLASRHRVDLVSLVHDDEEAAHVGDLEAIADSVTVARVGRFRKARQAATALLGGRPLTHALLDAGDFASQLAAVVRQRPPDAVLTLCSSMARFALAPPLAGLPFVLDMIDVDSEKWTELSRRTGLPKSWIYRREARLLAEFERLAANAADATLVVNERERASLAALGVTGRVCVIPNGVELTAFKPHTPAAAEPRVVFCGVMNYEPNEAAAIWFAQEVWPLIRRVRVDATLVLLGSSPTRRVRHLAEDDASIEVTGAVADVRPYLWTSAVSVAPLLVARGVQNKVLEAAAAELPSVVSTAVFDGLPAEVLPACVEAQGKEAFAAEVVRLLNLAPAQRRAIARRATLAPLAWDARLRQLEEVLQTAVPARRRIA